MMRERNIWINSREKAVRLTLEQRIERLERELEAVRNFMHRDWLAALEHAEAMNEHSKAITRKASRG